MPNFEGGVAGVIEDGFFSPNRVTIENLGLLCRRLAEGYERGVCELAELAFELARSSVELLSDMSLYELLLFLKAQAVLGGEAALPQAEDARIGAFLSVLSASHRAVFAELYAERLTELGYTPSEGDFFFSAEREQTFTYVRNSLSDEAYDVFSSDFSDPRVRYSDSFKEACALVADGGVGYCILPLEEKGGARISGISSMLWAYDLKIASVTPVFGFEGNADVKYALVCRDITPEAVGQDDDRYLEIRIKADSKPSLGELILAAESYEAFVYRANSLSLFEGSEQKEYYSLVFKAEGKPFSRLLMYLALFAEDYSVVGIYKNLE